MILHSPLAILQPQLPVNKVITASVMLTEEPWTIRINQIFEMISFHGFAFPCVFANCILFIMPLMDIMEKQSQP